MQGVVQNWLPVCVRYRGFYSRARYTGNDKRSQTCLGLSITLSRRSMSDCVS